MPWLRLEDTMLDHPKWRKALRRGGSGSVAAWIRLLSWCSRNLTDGLIPAELIEEVVDIDRARERTRALDGLVYGELLVIDGSGNGRLVDYLQRNPSREMVLNERERRADVQRKRRLGYPVTGHAGSSETPACPPPGPARPGPIPAPTIHLSEPAKPAADALPVVRSVFDEWQRVHSHPTAKLDAKRTARIRGALKLRGPDELKQAIRGALKDDWLMGRDAKSPRKYDGLETILRDAAQIERLIDLENGKGSVGYRPLAAGASRQTDQGVDPWSFHKKDRT